MTEYVKLELIQQKVQSFHIETSNNTFKITMQASENVN